MYIKRRKDIAILDAIDRHIYFPITNSLSVLCSTLFCPFAFDKNENITRARKGMQHKATNQSMCLRVPRCDRVTWHRACNT